jgi:hypothetical protein
LRGTSPSLPPYRQPIPPQEEINPSPRFLLDRAERFKVVTTILDATIDGGQLGDLYERRWEGEIEPLRYSTYLL